MRGSKGRKTRTIPRRPFIRSEGEMLWVGPDMYLFLLRIDPDIYEIWMMRDSTGMALRAGCVLRKECRHARQLAGVITEEEKADILEKANAWLATGNEVIVRDGEWFGIEYNYR